MFLKEGTGNLLPLDNGKSSTAGEVKQMMMEIMSLPYKYDDVFAMWLISPLLGE